MANARQTRNRKERNVIGSAGTISVKGKQCFTPDEYKAHMGMKMKEAPKGTIVEVKK